MWEENPEYQKTQIKVFGFLIVALFIGSGIYCAAKQDWDLFCFIAGGGTGLLAILAFPAIILWLIRARIIKIRARWVLFIAALSLGAFLFAPYLISPYLRFMDHTPAYYRQFADALEQIRRQHPLGTNSFLNVPVSDSSIPDVVRKLHPSKIRRFDDGVGVHVGMGRGGFAVIWARDDMHTNSNIWVLETNAEGLRKIVYSRSTF